MRWPRFLERMPRRRILAALVISASLVILAGTSLALIRAERSEGVRLDTSEPDPSTSPSPILSLEDTSTASPSPAASSPVPSSSPAASPTAEIQELGPTGVYLVDSRTGELRLLTTERCILPHWSRDGAWISCVLQGRVMLISADGKQQGVIRGITEVSAPIQFSLDGNRLAFLGRRALYVANRDGSERRLLVGHDVYHFDWSPDGRRLAAIDGRTATLTTVGPDGSDPRVLSESAYGFSPLKWSPDSTRIAYNRSPPRVVNALTGQSYDLSVPDDGESPKSWSPAGTQISMSSFRLQIGHDLVAASADGSGHRLLTRGASEADWSPDGRTIAFITYRNPDATGRQMTQLWLIDSDGSDERSLVVTPRYAGIGAPKWSPGGRWIVFSYLDHEGAPPG